LAEVLSESGFDVTSSKRLWLQLAFGGVFVAVRDAANAPVHGVHAQTCLQSAGLRVRGASLPEMLDQFDVPAGGVVLAVSNRE
jgi:hypothetical protein